MTLPKTCSLYESCDFWEGPGLVLTFPRASAPSPQRRVRLLAPLGHHLLALHEEGGLVGFPPARSRGSGDGFGTLRALPARAHVPTQDADTEPRRFSSRLRAGRASRLGFWGCGGLEGLEGEVVWVPATLKGALLWVLVSDLSWAAPPWPLQECWWPEDSQNHGMVGGGRDIWGPSGATPSWCPAPRPRRSSRRGHQNLWVLGAGLRHPPNPKMLRGIQREPPELQLSAFPHIRDI